MEELLEKIRKEALYEKLPIMDDDGLSFLADFIGDQGITSLLEVGTCIGYSAITLAARNPELVITTLEIDEQRHLRALENVRKAGLEGRIRCICCDSRSWHIDDRFSAILLDGPKAHNRQLLTRYHDNLTEEGWIIVDDVYFHGFLDNPGVIRTRRLRTLVRKFSEFQKELEADPLYECTRLNIGDGLLLAKRGKRT